MPFFMFVRHTVEDYDRWKHAFDQAEGLRKDFGSKGAHIFRNADQPNETFTLVEFENLEQAHAYANHPQNRERMQQAGVAGPVDRFFLEDADRTQA